MADAQHLPQGRRQAGDRHLKFHETRDNLLIRLDDLLAEVWPVATNGRHPRQLGAVSRALAIMHRMDVLVGIDH